MQVYIIKSDSNTFILFPFKKIIFKESWKNTYHCFQKNIKQQLFSTLIIIRYVSWAANQYIRMIYEGPCDAEDWNDDAENSACITEINHSLKYIKNENRYLKL